MNRFLHMVFIVTGLSMLLCSGVSAGVAGKITREILEETVERAAKRSGREALEESAKKSARETLEGLVKTYGDDALKVVDDAGIELLEAAPRYGDEVVELAIKASPQARRAFAQNIPELFPIARRVGTEALELEAKSPGLAVRAFKVFGDDAGKALARNVPAEDVPRLVKYAEKADSPATKKVLLEAYEKEGKSLFERIPAKLVLASGLTASMLYGTHSMTEPARATGEAINNSPDVADTAVRRFFVWGTVIILAVVVLLFWRFGLMPWQRPRHEPKAASNEPPQKEIASKQQENSEQSGAQDGESADAPSPPVT